METVEQLIVALGGTIAVATALDAPPSTVSSWKGANSIPHWRLRDIQRLAKRAGVEVPAWIGKVKRVAAKHGGGA
jgi:hypothetical protein